MWREGLGVSLSFEIIERARNGDMNAFEELVKDNQSYVYNIIYRMIGNKEDAMDLLQDTFLKAFVYLKDFRGDSSIKTWLYKIAYRTTLDYIKRNKFRETVYIENIKTMGTEDMIGNKFTKEILLSEIHKLPFKYRSILVLRDFEGMDYREISKVTNLSLGTVKSRLFRARKILKERLQKIPDFMQNTGERG